MARLVGILCVLLCLPGPAAAGEDKAPAIPSSAAALLDEARAERAQGKLREADVLLVKALAAARDGRDATFEDDVLSELLTLCQERSDWPRTEDTAVELVELRKRAGDLRRAQMAKIAQASAADNLGDTLRALNLVQSAEDWFREKGDDYGLGYALISKGLLLLDSGDLAGALRALREGQRVVAGEPDLSAYAATVLSPVYCEMGDYETALALDQSLLDAPSQYPAMRANTLARLALDHHGLGKLDQAEEDLRRCRAEFERLQDANGICATLLNLGKLARDRALREGSRRTALLEEALGLFREAGAVPRARVALVAEATARRAWALAELGRVDESRKASAEAAALADQIQDRRLAWIAEQALARADIRKGDNGSALVHIRRAARLVNELGDGLADVEQVSFLDTEVGETNDAGIEVGLASRNLDDLLEFLELGRGSVLLESLGGRRALRGVATPEALAARELETHAKLVAARLELNRVLADGVRGPALKAALDSHARAEQEQDQAVRELQRVKKGAVDLAWPVAAKLREVQATLTPSQVFVAYAMRPGEKAVALVVAKSKARVVMLADTEEIEAACARLRDSAASSERMTTDLDVLAGLVLKPLALDASVRTLLVSPEGALAFAPFPALALVGGGTVPAVALVPTAASYRILAETRAKTGERVLAVGDPTYGVPAGSALLAQARGRTLVRLEKSRDEVLAITAEGDRRLLGDEATPDALWKALSEQRHWRSVHFACHGVIDFEKPNLCALALTPSGGQDGSLQAADILRARIPADLVVLSACDSALGRLGRGMGIVGFVRAFFTAGAPRVVASLWKVDDAAAKELMTHFYARLRRGVPTSRALLEAQDEIRRGDPDPRHWAGWVLWGLED